MLALFVSLLCLAAASSVAAQPAPAPVPLDAWGPTGDIRALARAGDSLYLGGTPRYVGPFTGPLAAFDCATGEARQLNAVSGQLSRVVSVPTGGWIVTGSIRLPGDVDPIRAIARVAADGSIVATWQIEVTGGRRLNIATGDSLPWDVGVSGVTQLLATPIHVFLRTTVAVIAGFPSSGIGDPLPLAGMPTAMALTGTSVLVATQSVGGLNQVAAFSLFL